MTKSEAGKLGAEKSKLITAQKKQKRIDDYMLSPNSCKQCESILDYANRKKKFCNSSCSATHNNLKRNSRVVPVTWNCLHCNKEHLSVEWRVGKYCDTTCQHEYQHKRRIKEWKEEGTFSKGTVKRYLAEQKEGCWSCGVTEWNNKPLVLELEHIDGNSENNTEENLSLLCPNCHSQTDTYKGKNTGNGRHSRMKRYYDGKSY